MKEKLYAIPVNDAFSKDCECPVCAMYKELENNAVEYTMGPSYMEDDIRLTTDKIGFCARHMQMMYDFENRLGLALIMDTHMKNMIKEIELLQKREEKAPADYFPKKKKRPSFPLPTRSVIRAISVTESRAYMSDTLQPFSTYMKKILPL